MVVGVDVFEPAATVKKFAKDHKVTYPLLVDAKSALSKQYGVVACPTNYVLDASGKIIARSVGFDEAAMMKELKKLGVE